MDNSNYLLVFVASMFLAIFVMAVTNFRPWLKYALTLAAAILPCLLVYIARRALQT